MNSWRKSLQVFTLAAISAAGGVVGFNALQSPSTAHAADQQQQVQTTPQQLATIQDLSSVFKQVGKVMDPSVVNIRATKTVSNASMQGLPFDNPDIQRFFRGFGDQFGDTSPFGDQGDTPLKQVGTGSGVIMEVTDGTGYIVTNNHVAGNTSELMVTLSDGRVIKDAKLVGADPRTDIAVVEIKADHLIPAKWGDSGQLEPGDWVMAFGSPFGYLGSMTHGIVSALHRQAGILGTGGYENFIQVDAPINPGNSGGPLVNIHGQVVGINTAIASSSGGSQGIGFAIPSNQAKPIVEILKQKGKVTRAWLGAEIQDVAKAQEDTSSLGYSGDHGVLIRGVLSGAPASGQLKPGDVVTKLNNRPVKDADELRNTIALTEPGKTVTLGVYRNGKDQDVQVKLGELPDNVADRSGRNSPGEERQQAPASFGMRLSDPSDALARQYDLPDQNGAVVSAVQPNSAAARAGLRPGDVITGINGQKITTAEQARNALSKADPKKGIRFDVSNKDGSQLLFLRQG